MIGRAKNETYELVFGNLLIGIGGLISGMALIDIELSYLITWAAPIFAAGIIFDVRVLRKFSFELNNVKQSILNQMNTINRNITEIHETKKEIESTKDYLDSTMAELERAKKELEKSKMEIFEDNRVTNPSLLIRRLEKVENYTMFDLGTIFVKHPILLEYQKLISHQRIMDYKTSTDVKLVKLFSLVYNLMYFNNALKHYEGQRVTFEPLITLTKKKNRYFYLCQLKLYEYLNEIDVTLEKEIKSIVDRCYNSMIDSQDLGVSMGEPPLQIKEHFEKVDKLNNDFKDLVSKVNTFLTIKFPKDVCEKIAKLELGI